MPRTDEMPARTAWVRARDSGAGCRRDQHHEAAVAIGVGALATRPARPDLLIPGRALECRPVPLQLGQVLEVPRTIRLTPDGGEARIPGIEDVGTRDGGIREECGIRIGAEAGHDP